MPRMLFFFVHTQVLSKAHELRTLCFLPGRSAIAYGFSVSAMTSTAQVSIATTTILKSLKKEQMTTHAWQTLH